MVVVGGGPVGMKVAETARRRGHRVTLLERNSGLGGQIALAARQPEHDHIAGVAGYLAASLADLGVPWSSGSPRAPQPWRRGSPTSW